MNIAVLGAGSWAIALAVLLRKRSHNISMWEFNPAEARKLAEQRELPAKLPGIRLPDEITVTNDIERVFDDAQMVVCAVPAQTMRSTMKRVATSVCARLACSATTATAVRACWSSSPKTPISTPLARSIAGWDASAVSSCSMRRSARSARCCQEHSSLVRSGSAA